MSDDLVLAESSGTVLWRDGARLVLSDRGIRGLVVAVFVLAILTFNSGVVSVVLFSQGLRAGMIPLALFVGVVPVLVVVVGRMRARQKASPRDLDARVVIDTASGVVSDGVGQPLARLQGATLERAFQWGSSSRKLVLRTVDGTVDLVFGTPFLGGVAKVDSRLRHELQGWT